MNEELDNDQLDDDEYLPPVDTRPPAWYVKFPTYQYNEDVQALAKEHRLRIVDARYQDGAEQCEDPPELTLIADGDAEADAAAVDAATADDAEADDNHDKLIEYFTGNNLTAKPGVSEMKSALEIDTNGAEVTAAWEAYKAAE